MRPSWRVGLLAWLRQPSTGRGVFLILISTLGGSVMIAIVKTLAEDLHPLEIGFFRSLFSLLILAPFLLGHGLQVFRTDHLALHIGRGLITTSAILLSFIAISLTPIATVASLNFTSPLFAVILAVVVLGEHWGRGRVLGLAFGFAGTLAIVRPGYTIFSIGPLVTLGSAFGFAVAMVLVKILGRTESSLVVTFYTLLFGLPLAAAGAYPFWTWPTPGDWAAIAVMSLIGAFHQWSFVQAFKDADVVAVAPLTFTSLIWATVLGHFLFAEPLDPWIWIGGSLIFAGATCVIIVEGRQNGGQGRPVA